MRRRKVLTVKAGALALLAPVTIAGPVLPSAAASPATSTQAGDDLAYEEFTGTDDDFYNVPDPLPPGEPGDLIRVQEVDGTGDEVTLRIMYHSEDARGQDRAVTGVVTYPTSPAPENGWPVVSWAHGGVSMASHCAPSRAGSPPPAFGVEGVRVASDYVGLGPVGEFSPVLSRPSVGNSVIDAVRAARQLPDAAAGTEWLPIGPSAGGHGALAAHELAADRAPELDHVATVAFAPASDLDRTFGDVDAIVTSVVGAAMVYGAPSEHPEIIPEDYAGDELAALGDLIRTGCQPDFEVPVAGVKAATGDDFWRNDPLVTEPARSLLLANEVGDVAADAPVLLASGTDDVVVVIERVQSLFSRMCAAGQVTDFRVVDGADHDNIIELTPGLEEWVADRFAGEPAADSCGEEGHNGQDGEAGRGGDNGESPAAPAVTREPSLTG